MAPYRLGYVAISLMLGIGAGHRCRLANATPARLGALIAQNLEELERILLFNEARGIRVFRIGSSLVPFASHPCNRLRWWRTFARDFSRLGAIARRSGQRLSMHPGPEAASLSSARAGVRRASLAELRYATRTLDLLEQGDDARVVVHVGGAAPDRLTAAASAERFLLRMPAEWRRRIAIENDCRVWTAREAEAMARRHDLPFVADILHNKVLPSEPALSTRELLSLASGTWRRLGLRPKHHLASQRPDARPGAHADFIDPGDFEEATEALEEPADLMLEAKRKDRALFALLGPEGE